MATTKKETTKTTAVKTETKATAKKTPVKKTTTTAKAASTKTTAKKPVTKKAPVKKAKKEATIVVNANLTVVVPITSKMNMDAEVTGAIDALLSALKDFGMIDNVDVKKTQVFEKDE